MYSNKKRPLSCEINLSVIEEEDQETLRGQHRKGEVRPRKTGKSLSEPFPDQIEFFLQDESNESYEETGRSVQEKEEEKEEEKGDEEIRVLCRRFSSPPTLDDNTNAFYEEELNPGGQGETYGQVRMRSVEARNDGIDLSKSSIEQSQSRSFRRRDSLDRAAIAGFNRDRTLSKERRRSYNGQSNKDGSGTPPPGRIFNYDGNMFIENGISYGRGGGGEEEEETSLESNYRDTLTGKNLMFGALHQPVTHTVCTRALSVDNLFMNKGNNTTPLMIKSVDVQTKNKENKYKKKSVPFLSRVSFSLRSAFSEKDLTKLGDFSSSSPSKESLSPLRSWSPLSWMSSPIPQTRRTVNGLRQCDSLENVCDSNHDDQIENGLGLAAQPAAVNALSLPHIHQLSDYDEDNTNNDSPTENDPEQEVVKPTHKRSDKSKKTKLKRRRAYYRTQKDGRSKSLTHIDTLGESGMLLPGEDMEGRSGDPSTDKLGVPDAHSVRRRKLSLANKVSSCEYIMVVLEYYVEPVEEIVQASRGTTLREALERRGIDVTNIQVYAEGSRAALSLNTDTYLLGGKTVRVRARDESRSPVRSRSAGTPGTQPLRKTSTSHRSGQGRFLWGGASTEDCSPLGDDRTNGTPTSHEGSLKASKSKQNNRWSIFPSNTKDSKMDSLVQQLDLYSRQGIPKQPHLLTCQTYQIEQEVVVEDDWRTLVEGHEQLDDRQEQQQSAIWELVETEATYIHMLKVITDLFLSCLCNLQNESLLCEIDTDQLFSNIQEIYNANLIFWREHVCRMLEVARSTRQPLDPTLLTDGFYKFDELFHPYTRYCLDQSHCQLYCKEKDHDNEYFKMYLAWCETQKECNRLRLVDILVQPMQRLTKYSLLLKAILKKTNPEDHKLSLQDMITHVENFVSNVNSALRHKHEQERLRDIAKRIEAYEAVEARDDELEKVVKTYSDLSLTQPMPGCPEHLPRHILHHGDLRLRDPHSSKMDVHVFLFTDLLLITKVTQRKAEKVKIIRPPYHVERLILVELKDTTSIGLVSINEWNVAVAAFTLQCPDQRTHRTWHDALKRAKDQYKEAQQARDVMIYDDMTNVGHLVPRSPRPGSSRASRVSSLAHSHSGSIDLNEHSPASTHHPPSLDMGEIRASSASSDDSIAPAEAEIQRSKSLEGGGCCSATSPRPDRRPAFPKTPNTLSVIPPYSTGQSLPNLTVESANSLRVPTGNSLSNNPKALSACTRGVSYPPPSPRTLRRSAPVPQSRNPPLIKTRHVTSMVGSPQEVEQLDQDDALRSGGPRRISRTDRMDNRRYHTAGAIDDIKKQDTKDATIHKRLSWNYGQGPPPSRDLGNDQGKLGRHKHAVKSISCESMHSSSGVSSTSSLHRSMGSEHETLENIDDNELEDGESTVVDLTVSDCTSLKISPHISTTYICHDSDITLGVCSQYITQPNSAAEKMGQR